MRELTSWEFASEELQIIKSALMKFDKRSPYYNQAQSLALQLPVEPIHYSYNGRQEGLTEDIFQILIELGSATAPEIEKRLGLAKPNSVSAICAKLAKQGLLDREEIASIRETGSGLAAKYRYSVKSQHKKRPLL
jgi:uncharacterized protein YutE (UPF0331/DUF86 family)